MKYDDMRHYKRKAKGVMLFGLGCAAGACAVIGIDQLNKNKYTVKKTINDAIDNVTSKMH